MSDDVHWASQPRRMAEGTGPRLVVAGFDGTDAASNALAYAAGLAERTDADLLVVTVDPISTSLSCLPAGDVTCIHLPARSSGYVGWVHREIADIIGAARCRYEVVFLTGDPARMIEATADGRHADVLVVGRPRHPLLHLLGSVPAQLARRADRPVVVVP